MTASFLLGLLLPSIASASPYDACCAASGAGRCPETVVLVGQASTVENSGWGTTLTGAQELRCEGGVRWSSTYTSALQGQPAPGSLVTPLSAEAAACFSAACQLPPNVCLGPTGLKDCRSGEALDDRSLVGNFQSKGTPVLVNGQIQVATWTAPATRPPLSQGPARPVAASSTASRPTQPPSPVQTSAPSRQVTGPVTLDPRGELPTAPSLPCSPQGGRITPSKDQVVTGDEARMRGEFDTAYQHYAVAVELNPCNAYGWHGLGEVLMAQDKPSLAAQSYTNATNLLERHFAAWTGLGNAYSQLRRYQEARRAYEHALKVQPGLPAAQEALAKLPL